MITNHKNCWMSSTMMTLGPKNVRKYNGSKASKDNINYENIISNNCMVLSIYGFTWILINNHNSNSSMWRTILRKCRTGDTQNIQLNHMFKISQKMAPMSITLNLSINCQSRASTGYSSCGSLTGKLVMTLTCHRCSSIDARTSGNLNREFIIIWWRIIKINNIWASPTSITIYWCP